ncbi:unnamed protein product [Didymodactylos carnosus]|nr:unnamed protein product [Didymodactylos carnosus]CAF3691090.1 unnamed protein product [Didymodactylos carnosus]
MDSFVHRIISHDDLQEVDNILTVKNGEEITLIWYDEKIDNEVQNLMDNTNDCNYLCHTREQFEEQVEKNINEKIILIVSGQLAEETLSRFHNRNEIDSVYIFCLQAQLYQSLIDCKKYTKLVGVYTGYKQLFDIIQKQLRLLIKFRIFNQKQKAFRLLTNDSGGYLWYQLLKDFLAEMPVTDYTKEEMLACCRYQYRSNQSQLKIIDEFEDIYESPQAITWYTRDSFVYRIVNRAIRTQDVDALIQLRYFIFDLCTLLKKTSDEQKQNRVSRILYRGLRLTDTEIEQLKANEGKLIAANGFLSTTPSTAAADMFAANVIFEIDLKDNLDNVVFADISRLSYIQDEEEILFDLGTIFRLSTISYDNTRRLYIVKVTVENDIEQLYNRNDFIKDRRQVLELIKQSDRLNIEFGFLLSHMGLHKKAIPYYESLLEMQSINEDEDVKYLIYTYLIEAYLYLDQSDIALKYADLILKSNYTAVNSADCYFRIGLIYVRTDYENATQYFLKGLTLFEEDKDNLEILSLLHHEMGIVYLFSKDYLLSAFDPDIGVLYSSIALLFLEIKDYDKTLDYCYKALEIYKLYLPINHQNYSYGFGLLARAYYEQGNVDLCIEYSKKYLQLEDKPWKDDESV